MMQTPTPWQLFYRTPVSTLLSPCDSAMVCLSKGLGAPVGSVVVGTKNFISKVERLRKSVGGAMRQTGFLAAAGIYALDFNVARYQTIMQLSITRYFSALNFHCRLSKDHKRAQRLANIVNIHGKALFTTDYHEEFSTNFVFVKIRYEKSRNYKEHENTS